MFRYHYIANMLQNMLYFTIRSDSENMVARHVIVTLNILLYILVEKNIPKIVHTIHMKSERSQACRYIARDVTNNLNVQYDQMFSTPQE